LFNITGCAHLFGGEEALGQDLIKRLHRQKLQARIGIAGSVGCAWALAHFATTENPVAIVRQGCERQAVLPLPLASLRLAPDVVQALHSLGFKTVGDVEAKPRAPMAARFGQSFIRRLDQACGMEEEPISPRRAVPDFMAERRFAEPVLLEAHILQSIAQLAAELGLLMEKHSLGARRLEASLFHVDGSVKRIALGLSRASRDAALVEKLFIDRLAMLGDTSDPGFGFDMLRLSALDTQQMEEIQSGFTRADHDKELARLIDRLGARFGSRRVLRFKPEDTHIPERASTSLPASQFSRDQAQWGASLREKLEQDSDMPSRPIRLLARPEIIEAMAEVPDGPPVRFRWRRLTHDVARVEGPERIAMEWWHDAQGRALTRDYFRIEDKQGLRLWLYREGLYERETARPRWFVHGFFA
jgi:protein ImuB